MFGNMIADTYIKTFQSPVFDNPSNYGLDYEDVIVVASTLGCMEVLKPVLFLSLRA